MKGTYRSFLKCGAILVLAAICQIQESEGGKPGGTKVENIPVDVTFENRVGDRIMSVGNPTYSDGVEGVQAYIEAANGWVVLFSCSKNRPKSPCTSTGRYQLFDYTDWAGVPGDPDLDEIHLAGGNFNIHPRDGSEASLPGGFRDIMNYVGETRLAGVKVNYSVVYPDGFVDYTTRFAPLMYPDSDFVLVTYSGGALDCVGGCASWTVEAFTGTFEPVPVDCCSMTDLEDVAQLVNWDNSADFGRYHMPFKLTVTVKPR